MPYHCEKRDCKQSDGSSGSYVMIKDATGEAVSCHGSKESCEAAITAINANENKHTLREVIDGINEIIDKLEKHILGTKDEPKV